MNALSSGNLKRDYARFAVPTVISLAVFSLYSMVDGIFVGRFIGAEALAAVNLGAPFLNILFSVAMLLAVGTGTRVAALLGEGRQEDADRLFTQNVVVAAAFGVVITVLTVVLDEPICRLLGARDDTLADTKSYVGTLAWFSMFFILEYNLEVLVKTDGHPRLAMVTVICASALNAVLDWYFIDKLHWGIFGAAFATGLSQLLATCIFLAHFLFGKRRLLHLRRFRLDLRIYRRLLPIGVPDGLVELCTAGMTWLYNRTILRFLGTAGVAAFTPVTYVNTVMLNVLTGASQGMQPLVSYHRGAGEPESGRRLLRYAIFAQGALALVCFGVLQGFAPRVAELFLGANAHVIRDETVHILRRFAFSYLVLGFNIVCAGYLTASERPAPALAITAGRGFVVQGLMVLSLAALFGIEGVWWAPLTAELLVAAFSASIIRREHKMTC